MSLRSIIVNLAGRKSVPVLPPSTQEELMEKLLPNYLQFTRSRIRTQPERKAELAQLIGYKHVRSIGFARGTINEDFIAGGNDAVDWLLIATPYITISHKGDEYGVGEFISYFSRFNSSGGIDPKCMVENMTPPGPKGGACYREFYNGRQLTRGTINPHPHCNMGKVAGFCMPDGRMELSTALMEGEMFPAYRLVLSALRTYGPFTPIVDIGYWPKLNN